MKRAAMIATSVVVFAAGLLLPVVAFSGSVGSAQTLPCNPHKTVSDTGRPGCPTIVTMTTATTLICECPPPTDNVPPPVVNVTVTIGPPGCTCPEPTTTTPTTTTPTTTTTAPPPPKPPPSPVAGKFAVGHTVRGVIYFQAPGSHHRVKLTGTLRIPIGSSVDASTGTVSLTTAASHGTQNGSFHGGAFSVQQPTPGAHGAAGKLSASTKLVTTLALRGSLAGCPVDPDHDGDVDVTYSAHAAHGTQATIARRRPRRRRLWASESGGGWSTTGSDAAATVLGTTWLTEDTCAGTRIVVKRGIVLVHNLVNGRRVRVTAGHSYLARARIKI
jgi:hypothetical protein